MSQFASRRWRRYDSDYFARVGRASGSEKWATELRLTIAHLGAHSGQVLLDLGCGTGAQAIQARATFGFRVIGIDFAAQAAQLWSGGDFLRADAHALPFASGAFDHAYSMHSIGHVLRPRLVLQEVARVLKPGGRLAIVSPNRWFIYSMKPLNYLRIVPYKPDYTILRFYTVSALRSELHNAGFRVLSVFTFGQLPDLWRWSRSAFVAAHFRERIFALAMVQE